MGGVISHESRGHASSSHPASTDTAERHPKSKSMSDLSLLEKRTSARAHTSFNVRVEAGGCERGRPGRSEEEELEEVASAQVQSLRKEFEEVSAPNAFMNFSSLNKFQTRMIRRKGEGFYRKLAGVSPLLWSPKPSEKDIRALARKLCVRVFKKCKLWDENEDEPLQDGVVTFEQYLAVVYRMKIKQQENVTCVSRGEFGLKSILRPSRQEEEDGGQVEEVQHVRAVEFRDQLSDELMDEEWKARMKSSRRLRDEEEVELLRFRGLHIEECPTLSADDAPQHVLPGEHSGSETQADGEADEEVSKGRGGAGEDLDVGLINVLPHRSMSFKQFKEQKAEQPPTEVNLAYMNHLHQHLVREIVFELSEEEVLHKREVMEEIKKSIERELERQRDPRKEGKQSLQIK